MWLTTNNRSTALPRSRITALLAATALPMLVISPAHAVSVTQRGDGIYLFDGQPCLPVTTNAGTQNPYNADIVDFKQGTLTKPSNVNGQNFPAGTFVLTLIIECKLNGTIIEFSTVRYTTPNGTFGETIPKVNDSVIRITALAADPAVVGYYESSASPAKPFHAVHFDLATGVGTDLGTLTASPNGTSIARGVSQNGVIVTGYTDVDTAGGIRQQAFRWTQAGGMVSLGSLFGPTGQSRGFGISDDGLVIVGDTDKAGGGGTHAFRWTAGGGMVDIGTLGAANLSSIASAANGDGSVVVGQSQILVGGSPERRAFRWTQAGGMVNLGALAGHTSSFATAVDATGNIVVGISDPTGVFETGLGVQGSTNSRAFRWTQATGIQNINTLLTNVGVNLAGVTLVTANHISRDGQFISGTGLFPVSAGNLIGYTIRYVDATNGATPAGSFLDVPFANGNPSTPTIGGLTTSDSVQSSINQVGSERQAWQAHSHGFTAPLMGDNAPIGDGASAAGAFGSIGSAAGGAAGAQRLGKGLNLFAGLSYASAKFPGVSADSTLYAAGKLQYVYDLSTTVRPFVAIGGWSGSGTSLQFSRDYVNGVGTATGVGRTYGSQYYMFGRLGAAVLLGKKDEFAASFEYGIQRASTNGYIEPLSAQNPFEAHFSAATNQLNIGKLRAQWTHQWTDAIQTTLWGAPATSFAYRSNLAVFVPGIGELAPQTRKPSWQEYGFRIAYSVTDKVTAAAFANGVSGDSTIGTRVHVGGELKIKF